MTRTYTKHKMTKTEASCKTMADVCELAHKRTVADIRKLNKTYGFHYKVNCTGMTDCGDTGRVHRGDKGYDECETHYGSKAQEIFDDHYDYITNITGI